MRKDAMEYQEKLTKVQESINGIPDFKDWLIQYRDRDSIRGDFAYDVYGDPRFPRGRNKATMLNYLKYKRYGVCSEAISAFRAAYRAYESFLRMNYDEKLLAENKRLVAENEELRAQLGKER